MHPQFADQHIGHIFRCLGGVSTTRQHVNNVGVEVIGHLGQQIMATSPKLMRAPPINASSSLIGVPVPLQRRKSAKRTHSWVNINQTTFSSDRLYGSA